MFQFKGAPKETISNLEFGLNQKFKLKDLCYGTNTGQNGKTFEYFDMIFEKDGSELKGRVFAPAVNDNLKTEEERKESLNKSVTRVTNTINEVALIYVPEEIFADKLKKANSFKDYATIVEGLVKQSSKFKNGQLVDIFLEYQATLKGDRTFLEYPLFTWGKGATIHQEGEYQRTSDESVIEYHLVKDGSVVIDNTTGKPIIHPLKRGKGFFQTNKWKQQTSNKPNQYASTNLFGNHDVVAPTQSSENKADNFDDLPF